MDDMKLQQLSRRVGEQLVQRRATVTAAESCTGGWIAKVFTDINGSSAWFAQGFVTYSNQAKQQMVGVQADTLARHGAVSEETVREMAAGACRTAAAEYGIAVSGIAGPEGGTAEKPVGTVWFAIAGPDGEMLTQRRVFTGDREAVRRQSVAFALQTLLDEFLIN
ncbi:nicotinamide-nucleotide amidase [Pantoea sp. Mb-10]|uniref:nicotinamide-nucleotide amidase n=1 Tax=unclassified Pantoea TaxID=2630326 RepID=UPI001E57CFEA|nr:MULTISPECIES: nicotinamide-nucleotide amidase [unclassified Pantoea]MCE0489641.1 nicotinamide-nucleotide amidase [Pantoea sp. Mb-10]MCE0501254.1 nicotinamide-nucleotide amidase [Pantoea sp. Pb-8]